MDNTSQFNHFRELLEAHRKDVMSQMGIRFDTLAKMGRVAEEDQAQVTHEEFISLRVNGIEYQKLRQLNDALSRFDSGEFGICVACDRPIPEKRLQAIPWARYCVRCQERHALRDSSGADTRYAPEDEVGHELEYDYSH